MMENIINFFNEAWQKLYITIPVILAFISSFGGTIVYKFAKLITKANTFDTTSRLLVQKNTNSRKQLKKLRKQQAVFQREVCKVLRLMSNACLPHKRNEIKEAIAKVSLLIESDEDIDADFTEEVVEASSNKKTRKIKVKKAENLTKNN